MLAIFALGCDAASVADAGTDAGVDRCAAFVVPERPDVSRCDPVDPSQPDRLAECLYGSGFAGRWQIDDDGFPAYDFEIDQRCDPAATAYSPRPDPLRDPIHLVGNGRGLVAMAHASGGIEIYSQDRGHKWINRVDTWVDPRNPDYPPQLGGGFAYVVVDGEVRSTRFEDLPIEEALTRQSRRFGVGYYETITRWEDLVVRQRVFAPEADARALVAEITVENPTDTPRQIGLVELWDPNIHEVIVELATSDLLGEALEITSGIDRRRRSFDEVFAHEARWDPSTASVRIDTSVSSLPAEIQDRLTPNDADYFPDPMYVAALDAPPDAVWLLADELWSGTDRAAPSALSGDGSIEPRAVQVSGAGQPLAVAMRVGVSLAAGASETRRFAFGYVPGGGSESAALAELSADPAALFDATRAAWRDRMIWAAFDDVAHEGAVQRELAWSSYYTIANATFDEYHGVRLAGQGGSYKYIHGLDGAIGDLALFADALLFVDPELSRDTLVYAMGTQDYSGHELGSGRFPYATTGVGNYNDVAIYDQRSDAYWLVPSSVARYVAATRDDAFFDREIPFWPRHAGETGSVVEHARRALSYATDTLGFGARGIVALGTNDYADGITQLSSETTTPSGSSSVFNALFIAQGFPLASQLFASRDPALAQQMSDIALSQIDLIETQAWTGTYYERAFADSGNPLAPGYLFVEPQVVPILSGLTDDARRDALLDLVEVNFETPLGAMTTVEIGSGGPGGGPDAPQIGGVWPVASAWVTDAWSRRDASRGWNSFVRNTLFNHATLYPHLWYGIWSGPDSYNGPEHMRAGEADAHLATALTDYPVLNAHVHLGPIRALIGVLGIEPNAAGIAIRPRVPTETWTVRLARLWLEHAPDRFAGRVVVSASGPLEMRVAIPSALSGMRIAARVDGADVMETIDGTDVVFVIDAVAGVPASWEIVARR